MIKTSLNWIRILVVLTILVPCITASMVSAVIFTSDGSEIPEYQLYEIMNSNQESADKKPVMYFYDPYCESCMKVEMFIEPYLKNHPDTKIVKIDTSNSTEEIELFNKYNNDFNRGAGHVPVIYFGSIALEGTDDIINNFEQVYTNYTKITE